MAGRSIPEISIAKSIVDEKAVARQSKVWAEKRFVVEDIRLRRTVRRWFWTLAQLYSRSLRPLLKLVLETFSGFSSQLHIETSLVNCSEVPI